MSMLVLLVDETHAIHLHAALDALMHADTELTDDKSTHGLGEATCNIARVYIRYQVTHA